MLTKKERPETITKVYYECDIHGEAKLCMCEICNNSVCIKCCVETYSDDSGDRIYTEYTCNTCMEIGKEEWEEIQRLRVLRKECNDKLWDAEKKWKEKVKMPL